MNIDDDVLDQIDREDKASAAAPATSTVPATTKYAAPAMAPPGMKLVDPLAHWAQRNSSGAFFKGTLIKLDYRTGKWTRGESKDPIGATESFITNPNEIIDGWLKFVDGKRVDQALVRIADGIMPKTREELPDQDERRWPTGRDGKRRDPWQRALYLPMKGADGEVCAFSATGGGAIEEVADFVTMYRATDRDGKLPVALLASRSYEHKEFGYAIYVPVLRLVGWDFWEPGQPVTPVRPIAVPIASPAEPTTKATAKPIAKAAAKTPPERGGSGDMDDEIPF